MNSNVTNLLALARQGDHTSLQQLFELYRGKLKRLVNARIDRRLLARFDLSDVVQETLVLAYSHWPNFLTNPERPFYPWLREIACNRLIDLHRRHIHAQRRSIARERSLAGPPASAAARRELAEQLVDSGLTPSRHAEQRELRERVRSALEQLNPTDRELLIMRFLEDMTIDEIAAVLKISYTAVTSRQLRALQRLSRIVSL